MPPVAVDRANPPKRSRFLIDDLCLPGLLISLSMIASFAPALEAAAAAAAMLKTTKGPRKKPEIAAAPTLPDAALVYFCFWIANSASDIPAHSLSNSSKLKGIVYSAMPSIDLAGS